MSFPRELGLRRKKTFVLLILSF